MDMVPAYHGPRGPYLRQARLGPGQLWPGLFDAYRRFYGQAPTATVLDASVCRTDARKN